MWSIPAPDTQDNTQSVVDFQGVAARYTAGPEVLTHIDMRLARGSFHVLIGPSGAGKTTLLKLLYLSHRPHRGEARIFGQPIMTMGRAAKTALRRRIGVVFQDYRLLDHLTALENAGLPLRLQGQHIDDYGEDVMELLTWVGLANRMDAYPPTLSGGEKQRLAIARAVVAKPDLIIADEPTGSVDPEMGARIMRLFVELNKLGVTILIATHDMDLARRYGATIWQLQNGHLQQVAHGAKGSGQWTMGAPHAP
jgi:cell division transport system ATP-binding protein